MTPPSPRSVTAVVPIASGGAGHHHGAGPGCNVQARHHLHGLVDVLGGDRAPRHHAADTELFGNGCRRRRRGARRTRRRDLGHRRRGCRHRLRRAVDAGGSDRHGRLRELLAVRPAAADREYHHGQRDEDPPQHGHGGLCWTTLVSDDAPPPASDPEVSVSGLPPPSCDVDGLTGPGDGFRTGGAGFHRCGRGVFLGLLGRLRSVAAGHLACGAVARQRERRTPRPPTSGWWWTASAGPGSAARARSAPRSRSPAPSRRQGSRRG